MQTICHLSVLIHEQAKKYGAKPVLTFRNFGSLTWKTVSWNQFSMRVKEVSNAFLNLGVKPQETIGVFSQNCIQYLYTDFGAYGVRAISIPFYATSSEQQIQYMIQDAGLGSFSLVNRSNMTRLIVSLHCALRWNVLSFSIRVYVLVHMTHTLFTLKIS